MAPSPASRQVIRRRRTFVGVVGALLLALVAFLAFAPDTGAPSTARAGDRGTAAPSGPSTQPRTSAPVQSPPAYLAWMSGGFPSDFRARVAHARRRGALRGRGRGHPMDDGVSR